MQETAKSALSGTCDISPKKAFLGYIQTGIYEIVSKSIGSKGSVRSRSVPCGTHPSIKQMEDLYGSENGREKV